MSAPAVSKAMLARIKSFQNGPALDSIIKAHVKEEPGKSTGLWKTGDIEDVIENFNGFLCAVAAQKKRLSSRMLCRRLTKFFKTDHVTLEDFAGKLAQALRYCYFKGKKFTSGKKTSPAVLKVIAAYAPLRQSGAASSSSARIEDWASSGDSEEEADLVQVASSSDIVTDDDEDDDDGKDALAALQAAKEMYAGCDSDVHKEVIQITDSPQKPPQVPYTQPCYKIAP